MLIFRATPFFVLFLECVLRVIFKIIVLLKYIKIIFFIFKKLFFKSSH
jgi:hypothetical protein